jgi:drug/metabolite transporter (DMT)-like permease
MNNSLLYALTVLIWGSTWIAIHFQLGVVAPEVSIFYRFALAAIILFGFCLVKRAPLAMSLSQHGQLFLFGLCLFGINYYLLYYAQQLINSALSAIAFSALMVFNTVNARIWYKTQITSQVYIGGALGMLGIITLFWPQLSDVELGQQTLLGLGLCLVGTLSASMGNMLSIKNQRTQIPVMQANTWGMFYGALLMGGLALIQGKTFNVDISMSYISSLIFLSLFGSVIAFGCYLTLMNRIGAHKTSYANIMFPAVAVLISTLVEGFQWSWYTVFGFSAILLGNLVVLWKKTPANPMPTLAEKVSSLA